MESNSTINNMWKICILVSFIGCAILLLFINYGRNNITLSTAQSIPISATATPGPEVITTFMENKEKSVEGKKECNIFNGKWVYNPKASPLYNGAQCPFLSDQVSCQRNGRPDVGYQKWSWEAEGCEIPKFNGTDMLERLRSKRVIVVGDSLNRNQWESLACLLYSVISPSRAHVDVRRSDYKVFRALDYNCSIEFYKSPFLVQLDEDTANGKKKKKRKRKHVNIANGKKILKLQELSVSSQKWKGAHIMVFNTGHWWVHRGKLKAWELLEHDGKLEDNMAIDKAFEIAMNTWAGWIDRKVDPAKTLVFFRSISPQHKRKQGCENKTEPLMDESYVQTFPKPMIEIVERTTGGMKIPVKYLNITKLSQYRVDGHPTFYSMKLAQRQSKTDFYTDCSHWCLPGLPDTWNTLLYASMILSNFGGNSDS